MLFKKLLLGNRLLLLRREWKWCKTEHKVHWPHFWALCELRLSIVQQKLCMKNTGFYLQNLGAGLWLHAKSVKPHFLANFAHEGATPIAFSSVQNWVCILFVVAEIGLKMSLAAGGRDWFMQCCLLKPIYPFSAPWWIAIGVLHDSQKI